MSPENQDPQVVVVNGQPVTVEKRVEEPFDWESFGAAPLGDVGKIAVFQLLTEAPVDPA